MMQESGRDAPWPWPRVHIPVAWQPPAIGLAILTLRESLMRLPAAQFSEVQRTADGLGIEFAFSNEGRMVFTIPLVQLMNDINLLIIIIMTLRTTTCDPCARKQHRIVFDRFYNVYLIMSKKYQGYIRRRRRQLQFPDARTRNYDYNFPMTRLSSPQKTAKNIKASKNKNSNL